MLSKSLKGLSWRLFGLNGLINCNSPLTLPNNLDRFPLNRKAGNTWLSSVNAASFSRVCFGRLLPLFA